METDEQTLEQSSTKKPDLPKIIEEIQEAQSDSSIYTKRMSQTRAWWMCEWDGISVDGRLWAENCKGKKASDMFPWNGSADCRPRIVSTYIQEHVTLALAAFWSSKKQAKSIRPFVSGRNVNVAQDMLDWRVGTQMKRELLHEIPYALSWRYGGGLSFLKIEWEQMRELSYVPISMDMIAQLSQALGLGDVVDKILDPDKVYDKDLVVVLQSLSPVLPTAEARTVLNELRATGQSQLPVASLRVNKPKWSAKRPYIDLIFPSETCDIQQSRFTNERELVSETELTDRIVTDGYDDRFVEEALKHKGVFSSWWAQTQQYQGSNRNLVELNHFLSWRLHEGVPCLYRTVFNESVSGDKLYACHRKFEYDHGQFPFVAMRRGNVYRPLLSSIGIAEESYTDELDYKRQQDGLTNHADIVLNPPQILPTMRAQAMASSYGPRAVMTAIRPESVKWQPIPPMDQVPILVMQFVMDRLNRRYPLMAAPGIDPTLVALYRKCQSDDVLAEFELALEQTYQLMQQFETDEDIKRVAGGEPWNYSRKDIQGQYEISATCDINLIDQERAASKLDMLAKLLPFREQGAVFNAAANIVDPDLADMLAESQTSPAAQEKEKTDEYNAISQILSGMEARKPEMAMNQLRLNTIQEIMSDPGTMQKVMMDKTAQERIKNRVEYFQNRIQQFQENPNIGRATSATTFGNKAPQMSLPQAQ